jgi:hypothetical protein
MDSLFDDDQDEVGSEIEAYCPSPRCKADTNHTVISMYEDEIRRVQCQVCSDVHAYRKPRGDAAEAGSEEVAAKRKLTRKPSWEEAMAQVTEAELASCRPYSIRDTYEEMDVVSHPKFGTGFVTELLPDNKVELTFKDERRVLVHNRSDLAQKMPELAEMPAPRDLKKRKRKKKGPSELATRLAGDSLPIVEIDAETTAAKLAHAQRAAEEKRMMAIQMAATGAGLDESEITPAQRRERRRLEREAEKAKKAAEKEAERQKKAAEKEAERVRKEKENQKLRVLKEKERLKKIARMEREKVSRQKAAERARLRKIAQAERDREKKAAQAEREKARKQAERERVARQAEAVRERARQAAERERRRTQEQAARLKARVAAEKARDLAARKKAAQVAAARKKAAIKKAAQVAAARKKAAIAAQKKKAAQIAAKKKAAAVAVARKKAAEIAAKKKAAAVTAQKKKAALLAAKKAKIAALAKKKAAAVAAKKKKPVKKPAAKPKAKAKARRR